MKKGASAPFFVTNYELRVTNYELRITNYEYEFDSNNSKIN